VGAKKKNNTSKRKFENQGLSNQVGMCRRGGVEKRIKDYGNGLEPTEHGGKKLMSQNDWLVRRVKFMGVGRGANVEITTGKKK